MSQYTPEQVERMADALVGYMNTPAAPMLRAYASTLRQQARTCSDERPCINCFADQGECLGPAPETLRQQAEAGHDFKNFHRLLCERFGYAHDEKDWRRDQVSLIEWIARQQAVGVDERVTDEIVEHVQYSLDNHPDNRTYAEQVSAASVREALEAVWPRTAKPTIAPEVPCLSVPCKDCGGAGAHPIAVISPPYPDPTCGECNGTGRAYPQAALAQNGQPVIHESASMSSESQHGQQGEEGAVAWLPVLGIPGFEASNTGQVRKAETGRLLGQSPSGAGYLKVQFYRNGERIQRNVQRVIAEAFLGRREGMQVNHIDGDKTNNNLTNLEWVTKSQNEQHSRYALGNLCSPVIATHTETGEVREYPSQALAERDLGIHRDAVRRCLTGAIKSSMGWTFSTRPAARARVPDGEVRLWDTQWLNIVNHDNCYRDWDKADAINHAVKMTEQAIARNVADGKLPPPRIAAAPSAESDADGEVDATVPRQHQWDRDGERCAVCCDKDWMGGPCNGPRTATTHQEPQA